MNGLASALRKGLLTGLLLLLLPLPCLREPEAEIPQKPLTYTDGPISAYDAVIRKVARKEGWDWRLLAAIVYHESRFTNEATSGKGATGLMQINSRRYSEEALLDPETNLSIGARYLKKLQKMFPAASPVENLKFALAAFNLGDGRLRNLIREAGAAGADTTRWDNVSVFLPPGHHTLAYVEKVLDSYDNYRRQYPE